MFGPIVLPMMISLIVLAKLFVVPPENILMRQKYHADFVLLVNTTVLSKQTTNCHYLV